MKLLLPILIAGGVLYFLIKIGLFLLRPFFLAKILEEIEQLYTETQAVFVKDLEQAIENSKRWRANDKILRILSSEKDFEARIQDAQAADRYNKDVHEKFIRLKERFIQNPSQLADSIVVYKRYLEMKLTQNREVAVLSQGLTSGALTLNEFESSARETRIILEELERKINVLLSN